MQVKVYYWERMIDAQNWYCWAYTDDNDEFVQWMRDNMEGEYECIHRFNSGNPMFTVTINDETDALKFKLAFNVKG